MYCHCGTNNRTPRWTFTDPCKPEVRPGAREESASPARLVEPAMNARDTTKGIYGGLTLDMDWHYIGSVTSTTHQEKGIITLESKNLSRRTELPSPHDKGNNCDKNVHDFKCLLAYSCPRSLYKSRAAKTKIIIHNRNKSWYILWAAR